MLILNKIKELEKEIDNLVRNSLLNLLKNNNGSFSIKKISDTELELSFTKENSKEFLLPSVKNDFNDVHFSSNHSVNRSLTEGIRFEFSVSTNGYFIFLHGDKLELEKFISLLSVRNNKC